MASIAPTQSQILQSLRTALLAILPDDVDVIQGQPNRTPEPTATEYVVLQPPNFVRLETNEDSAADVRFVASIAANVLTVTQAGGVPDATTFGTILAGAVVFGAGVAASTKIVSQSSGAPGGIGAYVISGSPQTVGSEVMASGAVTLTQHAEVIVQIDFHSASGAGGDMAQAVSTVLRDETGVQMFLDQIPNYGVEPLYADDPTQRPFFNDQQQLEYRWAVDAHLQANQVTSIPLQYADSVSADVVSVLATYPT